MMLAETNSVTISVLGTELERRGVSTHSSMEDMEECIPNQ